jgi:hypothetical protein
VVGEAETSPGCHNSFSAITISPTMMVIKSAIKVTVKQNRMGIPFGVLLDRSSVSPHSVLLSRPCEAAWRWSVHPPFAGRPGMSGMN